MAEPQVVTTLRRKRDEIEGLIETYERRLKDAKRDLEHVTATLALFETATASGDVKVYQSVHRLFRRGEMVTICKAALAEHGPLDTRELSRHVMRVKGFNEDDEELRKAITYRIVQALRMQHKRGAIGDAGRRGTVRVWRYEA